MKRLLPILLCSLLLSGLRNATAQEASKTWTLQECLDYAYQNNIQVRQSRNNQLSGIEDTKQAKAALFPSLVASTTQSYTNYPSSEVTDNNSYTGTYGITAGMTIFEGGKLRTEVKRQKVQNQMDALSVEESVNDIRIAIVQAYMQCLYAADAVRINRSTAEASKAQRDRAEEMLRTGSISRVDFAQLQSQYSSDEYQIVVAGSTLDNYKLQLKQLLELDIMEEMNPAVPGVKEENVLKALPPKNEVYETALKVMPQIRRGELGIEAAKLEEKSARAGFFPSISGGWNFSEEHFMENTKSWLSQGKLRVGWGEIGNQTIPAGAYLSQYSNGHPSMWYAQYYMFGNTNPTLFASRSQVGNPNLKWETTRQLDLGLDLAFLEGSLRFTFDYYSRDTKDMLVQVPNPASMGFPNTPWVNAGSISNKGFEVSIGYDGKVGNDFKYHINGNVSTYKNKIKDLGSEANIPGKEVHLGYYTYTMTEVGKPLGYYYGYKTDGVFQTQQEIDNYQNNGQVVMPNAKPGDLKFVDLNKDGKLGDEDRTMIGNPHPDFTFGLTLGAEYKGFDFSAFFQGSVGNDLLNIVKYDIYGGVGWYNAPKDILTTFWNGPGSTNENFAIDADSRLNREMSEWYVEDGSYVRLKNLTIGYTLPSSITRKITLNNLRIFVAAQNLFTITGYSGLDPEIGEFNQNPIYKGIDMGYYPQARTFMFGISMKL